MTPGPARTQGCDMGETVVPELEEEWQELPRGNLRAAAVKSLSSRWPSRCPR